jgi:hypothetical protein
MKKKVYEKQKKGKQPKHQSKKKDPKSIVEK